MDTTRRGNYDSGEDFVLEYGELRFTFNERDFMRALRAGRAEARVRRPAASTSPSSRTSSTSPSTARSTSPRRALGEHVNDCWPELVGPSDRSLVHWLRRLVFRSAWLDQRVKEGELDVAFDVGSQTFAYVQPDRGGAARRARARALVGPGRLRPALIERLGARLRDRPRAVVADEQLGAQRAAAHEVERGEAPGAGQRGVERDDRRLAADRQRRRRR